MTSLRLALAGLLAALGLVVLTPTSSVACSCAISGERQLLQYADTVFTGTLTATDVPPPDEDGVVSSTDPVTYRFDVDRVLEGDVATTAEVTSARWGASCGLEGMRVGQAYVVFASTAGRTLEANLCGGTRPERDPFVDRIAELTGPPRPPTGDAVVDVAAVVAAVLALLAFGPS
ncbi:hypothetical protein GCM10027062_14540 [Nocardioides hungaricus]